MQQFFNYQAYARNVSNSGGHGGRETLSRGRAGVRAILSSSALNARRGASNIVLLTRLGGGAFGNDDAWIDAAIRRALTKVQDFGLDVRLVSFGAPPPSMLALQKALG
jgi:hypothetical protein